LLQSQRRHPILRAAIRMNRNGKPGLVPSNEPISLRVVQRANRTQWIHEVETELALPFERWRVGKVPGARFARIDGRSLARGTASTERA
jgi:hypothetical protein